MCLHVVASLSVVLVWPTQLMAANSPCKSSASRPSPARERARGVIKAVAVSAFSSESERFSPNAGQPCPTDCSGARGRFGRRHEAQAGTIPHVQVARLEVLPNQGNSMNRPRAVAFTWSFCRNSGRGRSSDVGKSSSHARAVK